MKSAIGLLACVLAMSGLCACTTSPGAAASRQLVQENGVACTAEYAAEFRSACRTPGDWKLAALSKDEQARRQERADINVLNTPANQPRYRPRFEQGPPAATTAN